MNEVLRLQYLEAMGVDSYIPRRVLPGARASALCEWPVIPEAGSNSLEAEVTSAGPADRQLMSRLQQDLGTAPRKAPPSRPVAPPADALRPAFASSPSLQFRLAIFQPASPFLVLVPGQHLENRHLQLLGNILLAIGVRCDALVPTDTFSWPPYAPGVVRGEAGCAAARETLHALLEGYQLKHGAAHVLAFAGELAEQLFAEGGPSGLSSYCLPDLEQMLQDSRHKKVTWQKIRGLAP